MFVVHNGQQFRRPQAVRNDALHIAGPVLGVMLSNSTDGLLLRAYTAAIVQGYHFRLVSIPDDAEVGHNFLAFDPNQMQASFDIGYELGRAAEPWKSTPPIMQDIPTWLLDPSVEAP